MTKDQRHQDAAPPRPVDAERVGLRRELSFFVSSVKALMQHTNPTNVNEGHAQQWFAVSDAIRMKIEPLIVALAPPAHSPDKAADEDARLSLSGNPMPPDGIEGCCICGEAFKEGDMVLIEVNEGEAHVACCGPERDGYVNLDTGEPIGPDEPIPAGYPWPAQSPDKAVTREGVDDERLEFLRREYGEYERDAKLGSVHGTAKIGEFLDLIVHAQSLAPKPAGTEAGRGVGAEDEALRYAESLCRALYEKHWTVDAPEWQPLAGDLIGLLSQIDNMTAGLTRAATPTPPVSPTPDRTGSASQGTISFVPTEDVVRLIAEAIAEADESDFSRLYEDNARAVIARLAALAPSAPIADPSPDSTGQGDAQNQEGWRPISTAPKDGTPIWAYLYDSGIREVSWWSAEAIAEDMGGRPEQYQEGFYEGRSQDEWCPRWWLPLDALPDAPPAPADRSEGGR